MYYKAIDLPKTKGTGTRMKSVGMAVADNVLDARVDLSKEFGSSLSGKRVIIAPTEGSIDVPGWEGIKVGLSVYKEK